MYYGNWIGFSIQLSFFGVLERRYVGFGINRTGKGSVRRLWQPKNDVNMTMRQKNEVSDCQNVLIEVMA